MNITWKRLVPVRYQADVVVVGGGMAGVSAACAAAREGASVILIEYFNVTGGNATVGGVGNWSGETRGQGGIFDEIIAMQEAWKAIAPYPGSYRHFAPSSNRTFNHEVLGIILQELLLRHGVKLLLNTSFVDARLRGSRITEILVHGGSGVEAVQGRVFVDCTGEALVARAAGFATLKGRDEDGMTLPASLMFFVREHFEGEQACAQLPEGWFNPVSRKEDLPMTSLWPNGPGEVALKLKIPGFDSADTRDHTRLEVRARQRMFEVLDYFQRVEKRPWVFDHASPRVGLREGRRIVGDYILRLDDLRAGRPFDDGVARGVFYLDGMTPDSEKRTYILPQEAQKVPPYHIPLRSLIARDGQNLLMAGRCISSDQLSLSSARVMPTCSMMGQAAGTLAAISARSKRPPRQVAPARVITRLKENGADLSL